jgi:hypothetical protein
MPQKLPEGIVKGPNGLEVAKGFLGVQHGGWGAAARGAAQGAGEGVGHVVNSYGFGVPDRLGMTNTHSYAPGAANTASKWLARGSAAAFYTAVASNPALAARAALPMAKSMVHMPASTLPKLGLTATRYLAQKVGLKQLPNAITRLMGSKLLNSAPARVLDHAGGALMASGVTDYVTDPVNGMAVPSPVPYGAYTATGGLLGWLRGQRAVNRFNDTLLDEVKQLAVPTASAPRY